MSSTCLIILLYLLISICILFHISQRITRQLAYYNTMPWTFNTPDQAPNDGPQLTAVAIALTTSSFMVLSLRVYVRGWILKALEAGTMSTDMLLYLLG